MRAMDVRTIEARVHGRYLVRAADPRRLLAGFHGYGENAEEHMAQLERIPGADAWTLVAVQALHPFYRGRTGEVVASWMTKQERELAIADNIDYVRRVVAAFGEAERIVFAGFSQGTAMAYRAASVIRCDGLLILAGDVPPDVARKPLPRVLIGRGRAEEWYTAEKLARDLPSVPGAEVFEFDGGHEWTEAFRLKAGEWLATIA
jgi:predicted esterase